MALLDAFLSGTAAVRARADTALTRTAAATNAFVGATESKTEAKTAPTFTLYLSSRYFKSSFFSRRSRFA
jgi:hypothetical protein